MQLLCAFCAFCGYFSRIRRYAASKNFSLSTGGAGSASTVSPSTITLLLMSRYCGQFGRPDPFGSPLVMKLTQYEDIVSASFESTSFHVWLACPLGLLNA